MIALHGRTALVTGGSRGIGRAVALSLARAGAHVAIGYRSRAAEAEAAAAERLAAQVAEAFGRLDIFVSNSGIWPHQDVPLARLSAERWGETVAANLDAVYHSTRAALSLMGSGGRIVLVSSTAGQRGESGHADYAAAKGGLIALTKSLAIECAPDILVNCVAPGWVSAATRRRGSPPPSPFAAFPPPSRSPGRSCSCAAISPATSPARSST